ncbi:unnamed protein product [Tetraodon nigroviridis]|uniref:(spotted green pufferfish) hypothetical protein n=1 Tax=Tetraodon nigroviridis TaxID=99883 RepID=Q4RVN4_TETNG|nr:unnamed protein product [Tetraodon nigroviridis]
MCPVTSALLHREQIQCDPEFIQVTREVPYVNWGNELQWFLSLSNNFIVALEDASLIQMNTVLGGTNITVQGRRKELVPLCHMESRRLLLGPQTVPLLSQAPVGFTVEQSHGGSTAPAPTLQGWTEERMAEVSTAESLHAQLENSTSDLYTGNLSTSPAANASVVFGGDDAASINATQRTSLDFLNQAWVTDRAAMCHVTTNKQPDEIRKSDKCVSSRLV